MKLPVFLLLLASAPLVSGQTFVMGQAARAEIGQLSFSRGDATPSSQILGGVGGIAWANGTLFVADDNRVGATPNNNRVMMFNTTQIPGPHDDLSLLTPFNTYCLICGYPAYNVIGQTSLTTGATGNRSSSTLNNATGVATDGTILAIADTNNNRVLIYNSIPTTPGAAANVVLGQPDFINLQPPSTTQSSLRGPQGVWINNGKLFVADTQNNRVLIWNHIPTSNNQPADIVLGQPNFTSANQPPDFVQNPPTAANQLLSPVSVTTDPGGTHLFVSDLGSNRVLIWNSIPTTNDQPADVVIGQPDMVSSQSNNTNNLCPAAGTDSSGKPFYPTMCNKTISFPRFALSDGTRLFVADGGNDRVLIFNSIPTQNGAGADMLLGQPDFFEDVVASGMATFGSTAVDNTGSVDTVQDPTSLAWDGTNLYVSDPYDRRVLLFTPVFNGDTTLPEKSVLNAASRIIRQEGFVSLAVPSGGKITANDTVTITIASTDYKYTIKSGDTLTSIVQGLITAINSSNNNAGDPNVYALTGAIPDTVFLTAKNPNAGNNSISLSATSSNLNNITVATSGSYLTGGTATTVAPGTLIEIDGTNLADTTQNANTSAALPLSLGGVQVYIDGFNAPLLMISPTQIITEVPFSLANRSSSSVYVRTQHNNGQVTVTNAVPIVLVRANPGLFGLSGAEPRPAMGAMHASGNPTAVVSIDGTIQAGDTATITVAGTAYSYTVTSSDTLITIAQNLVNKINGANDPNVTASLGGAFARVVLTAKQPAPASLSVTVAGSSTPASGKSSAAVTATAYNSNLCCVNANSGPVTASNPALPGEIITFLATGLGLVQDANGNPITNLITGLPYNGPTPNTAISSVSALVNNATGQVISAGLPTGSIGVYQVQIQMPANLATNANTQVNIAQDAFVSNIVTIPSSANQGSLFASPNPVPASSPTTLYWYVPGISNNVQLHIGDASGPVVGSGGQSGAATLSNVVNGETIVLVDVASSNVLGTTTLSVQQPTPTVTFAANPNPILVPQGTTYGRTTISWSVSSGATAGLEVHVNSPTGPLFSYSPGSSGLETTGNWVSDGITFYLVDHATGAQLGSLVVHLKGLNATITAAQNPVPLVPGTPYGQTTINWTAPTATQTEVHVGSPGGPLFAVAGSSGSATTGAWITNGTVFYLQDASNGNSTSASNTLGALTLQLQSASSTSTASASGQYSITISPNPVPHATGSSYGQATVNWSTPSGAAVEVHVNSATGPLFAESQGAGSSTTGDWITNGTTFYLIDGSTHAVLGTAVAQLQ